MGVELVVLDFDGNLTEVDIEAIPFVKGYKTDLAKILNTDAKQLESRWNEAKSVIVSAGKRHRKLKIPAANLSAYLYLVRSGLNPGFWNEVIGAQEIIFVFKFKDF